MKRTVLIATMMLAACGGSSQSSTQPSPYRNVVGAYSSDTLWHYRFVYIRDTPGELRIDDFSCPGTLTITRQDVEKFSGTFTQSAPCPSVSGTVTGNMTLGPYVSFTLSAGGDFVHTLERLTGCSDWFGVYALSGIVPRAGALEARVGGQLECPDGRVMLEFDVATSR